MELSFKYVEKLKTFLMSIFILFFPINLLSQDERNQIPTYMQKSFFEVNLGYIHYPFSEVQMQKGFQLASNVEIPHVAVRLILAGYDINKYLGVQITYMRPVNWVKYNYTIDAENNLNQYANTVWMNVGGLTLKGKLPVGKKINFYGEAGLGLITRHGFNHYNGVPVISDFTTAQFLFGVGFKYKLSDRWEIQVSNNFSPPIKKHMQPYTFFTGGGFVCHLLPFSQKKIDKGIDLDRIHPLHWVQLGYTNNILGYSINNFVSEGPVPIFWGGKAEVKQGININYQRNVLHGAKIFSLDWGANIGYWQTNLHEDNFMTFSLFPVFRFNFLHNKFCAPYFYYSVAGPTFMTKKVLDGFEMGAHFTFMDNMGIGFFIGQARKLNLEFRIGHYSNGNIFPENKSVKVPLTLQLGWTL